MLLATLVMEWKGYEIGVKAVHKLSKIAFQTLQKFITEKYLHIKYCSQIQQIKVNI